MVTIATSHIHDNNADFYETVLALRLQTQHSKIGVISKRI